MALDRLLREEEPLADLAVHEAVGDQLEHLDLAGGRLLAELAERAVKGITSATGAPLRRRDAASSNRRL